MTDLATVPADMDTTTPTQVASGAEHHRGGAGADGYRGTGPRSCAEAAEFCIAGPMCGPIWRKTPGCAPMTRGLRL